MFVIKQDTLCAYIDLYYVHRTFLILDVLCKRIKDVYFCK